MARLLIFAILIWVAYHIIKMVARDFLASLNQRQDPDDSNVETEMIRDPQCGAYFMKQKGVKAVIDGRMVYFCSRQCHDSYVKSRNVK